jgi:orotate phosphoribosyltransferase
MDAKSDDAIITEALSDLDRFMLDLAEDGAITIDLEKGFSTVGNREGRKPPTPMYFNFRPEGVAGGQMKPIDFDDIAGFFCEKLQKSNIEFDVIAAVPLAGEPIAQALAKKTGKDVITFDKDTGEMNPYPLRAGTRVLLVDDVISDGKSKGRFIRLLQNRGCRVIVLVIVDRGQGGAEFCSGFGVVLHSLMHARRFLALLYGSGRITQDDKHVIARRMWG